MKSVFGAGSVALCLGAAAVAGLAALPGDAAAQRPARGAAQQAAKPAGLDLKRGAAEAPAAVQAAGLRCTVAEAGFIGTSTTQVNGAAVPRNAFEVACQEGLGYIVLVSQTAGAAPSQTLDCVALQTTSRMEQAAGRPAGVQCRLPRNAQPAQGLQFAVREAGLSCTVTNARALGTLSNGAMRYEVGCAEGPGLVLDRPISATGRFTGQTCFRAEATSNGQFRCEYSTKTQNLASLAPLVTAARRSCTVSDARIVGRNPQTQNEVLEVGCGSAPGFFIETSSAGAFVGAHDCGRFNNVPCQLTAAELVQARNAQEYTRLLKAANFNCDVSNFNRQGAEQVTGREIVEVACSNRPDGAFAILSTGTGPSEVYDCLLAAKRRQTCRLTQEDALYPQLTQALGAKNTRCNVSMTRRMGTTPQGEDWYEFACKEGRNFIVDYRGNGRFQQVLSCEKGAEVLGGCKLPRAAAAAAPAARR